ncbi:MAG: methyltransferase [Verrucomicrobiota bacterium]|nr:methyltransferase [Chthoniobacterales bacterium]MDQ3414000.1 methyltransferase [Verrucomicrobiota bacterium]
MSQAFREANAEFDAYATKYDATLAQGISISGENKNYFARGRVAWLARCLSAMGESPRRIMDFGCGTGSSIPFLLNEFVLASVLGVDVSAESLAVAERLYGGARVQFSPRVEEQSAKHFDLAFCNGVFHHIPLIDRSAAINSVYSSLRSGGLFAFWENNSWNPGTRYIMSRIPFDRDAVTLSPPTASRLLRAGGFEIIRTDFLFFFPRCLSWLRFLERNLTDFALGAQYQILCRKPVGPRQASIRTLGVA